MDFAIQSVIFQLSSKYIFSMQWCYSSTVLGQLIATTVLWYDADYETSFLISCILIRWGDGGIFVSELGSGIPYHGQKRSW